MESEMYDNTPDLYNEDENEIDWNEQLLEMEEDIDETIDEDTDEEEDIKPDDSSYLTPVLTEKYIRNQLFRPEFNRDKIKFYYKDVVVYGHVLGKSPSGKYLFDLVDLSTGIHTTKALDGAYIDSF